LAPGELRGRALGPGRAAAQDLGEAPVAVELERLLADPEHGELLSQDGIAALLLLLDEAHEAMQRVAQRDVPDEGKQIPFVRQGGDGDAPPFIELPDQVPAGHPHVVEENLVELGFAGELAQRPYRDPRRLHVDEQEADALVLGGGGVGADEQEAPVGDVRHAGPDLLAVHDEVIAVAHAARLEIREIRTRVRLRESLAPELVGREDLRMVTLMLRRGHVFHEVWPGPGYYTAVG